MDAQLLNDIYDRQNRPLFVFILRFVRSRETAEDILHDAFVRLIQYCETREFDDTHVRAFLYTTARNLCIDHARHTAKIRYEQITETDAARTDGTAERVEMDEILERIDRLVETRDGLTRSIFYMKTELGMTYDGIARDLDISERTAKRKMSALIEYLAAELDTSGYSGFFSILLSWMLL